MHNDFISTLELSVRTANVLRNNDITTPQLLYNLSRAHWLKLKGGGARTWREIEEIQEHFRKQARKDTTLSRAVAAVKELNRLREDLAGRDLFITKDTYGRFRVGRFITRKDLEDG